MGPDREAIVRCIAKNFKDNRDGLDASAEGEGSSRGEENSGGYRVMKIQELVNIQVGKMPPSILHGTGRP